MYIPDKFLKWILSNASVPLLSGGDKETVGVIFSSNLAVLLDNDVDEPDVEEDSLNVTVNRYFQVKGCFIIIFMYG